MTGAIYAASRPQPPRAWCEIDLTAVQANARALRQRAGVPLVPMVKADAYGVGASAVAHALGALAATEPAHAPWGFGVATTDEALALRAAGVTGRVLCTSPVLAEELPVLADARVTPALHEPTQIVAWRTLTDAPWHLAIDTGMARAGLDWRQVERVTEAVAAHPPEGVFTHYHSADLADGSREQQDAHFRDALASLPLPSDVLRHADNSAALGARPGTPWDLARPGLALYGGPVAGFTPAPVVHVHARIVDVHELAVGDTVSYGATFTATRPTRLATVPVGYGDGYRRALAPRAEALLHGQRVPVRGVITMDFTMFDITEVGGEVGDVITLLGTAPDGRHTLSLAELADRGALSPYELLVGWRLRLPRVYRTAS